jgi:6-phosphogluconolactonase
MTRSVNQVLRQAGRDPSSRRRAAAATALLGGLAVLTMTALAQSRPDTSGGELLVYFGTYTGEKSRGIHVSRLDLATGALTPPELAADTPNPSFLAVHPNGRILYAANEVRELDGEPGGAVSGFAIDRTTGDLTPLNRRSSRGSGAVHLVVDDAGRHVLVANYGGGSVAVLPLEDDGRLKPASAFVQHEAPAAREGEKPIAPRAHSITLDPANRFAYVPDLGLDQVRIYRFDGGAGSLEAAEPPFAPLPAGAGPRHFAFHPSGRFAYVINEKHVTITAFGHDAQRGALAEVQTISTLPPGQGVQAGYSTAEVQVHPSGRFLYGSNRGHDSIAVFAIDEQTGRLALVQHEPTQGSTPRGFGIDPGGRYLLAGNQRSDTVVVFRIDQETGRLTPTGHRIEIGSPVAVKFVTRESGGK